MRMSTSEAMVETLRVEGVTVVPGIVGSAFMDALDLFPAAGIRFLPVRHEQTAGHMADAFARVTGDVAVCIGQNGPGVTNMVTSIAAAYHAHSPVMVVTPSATTGSVGLDGFQEIDQMSIFRSITKFQIRVPRPDRMAETFRTAFRAAHTHLGPVQVDVPRDYFYAETDEVVYETHRYRAPNRPAPEHDLVEQAAALLAAAKSPVIVAGYGAVVSGAQDAIAALAEFLSAPVATSYQHNDAFPASHSHAVGPIGYMGSKAAMRLMAEADVVLLLGSRNNVFGTVPQYGIDFYPSDARIIQVDVDGSQIGRAKPVDVGIVADARQTCVGLLTALKVRDPERQRDSERVREIQSQKEAWRLELDSISRHEAGELLSPRHALRHISDILPADVIVTTDIGNICSVANAYLEFDEPRTFLAALTFGNCGFAYPASLGAKLARPNTPVVAMVGDGAWAMGMQEVMTAVEEDLPVVALVFNNGQWGAEKRNQIDYYSSRFIGTEIGARLGGFKFADIAQSMGARGIRVSAADALGDALREGLHDQMPTVIEIMVDPEELAEPFRRDALKPPVRYLDRYRELSSV